MTRPPLAWLVAGAITVAVMSALGPLITAPGGVAAAGELLASAYVRRALRFTLLQAGLSAGLAVSLGLAVALALVRLPEFRGRRLLLRLFAVPMALPQLVAVLGLLAIFGRIGLAGLLLTDPPPLFGLGGILLAHVFFNMPFAALVCLGALERIAPENWRLARQAGMGEMAIFRLIEWPQLRPLLPGLSGFIFMLCAASFTVVLTLGGGPQATTLEVALYQSLRFDFEPARAGLLALLQVTGSIVLFATARLVAGRMVIEPASGINAERPRPVTPLWAITAVAAAGLFTALPLAGAALGGLQADLLRLLSRADVWQAIVTSLVIGALAGLLSTAMCWVLLRAGGGFRLLSFITLAVSPAVLGAGWFMLLGGTAGPLLAASLIIIANSLMAMPLVGQVLGPALRAADEAHARLAAELGLAGLTRLRLVDWPVLKRPASLACLLAMAVSLGDLGVIAFFGARDFLTLPYLLYLNLGSYRSSDGAGLALVLGLMTFVIIGLADRISASEGRRGAA